VLAISWTKHLETLVHVGPQRHSVCVRVQLTTRPERQPETIEQPSRCDLVLCHTKCGWHPKNRVVLGPGFQFVRRRPSWPGHNFDAVPCSFRLISSVRLISIDYRGWWIPEGVCGAILLHSCACPCIEF
jgi:hypothetical protein